MRGFPVPPSLHVNVPVTPVAVIVDVPQLLMTLNTGVVGLLVIVIFIAEDVAEHPLAVTTTV